MCVRVCVVACLGASCAHYSKCRSGTFALIDLAAVIGATHLKSYCICIIYYCYYD